MIIKSSVVGNHYRKTLLLLSVMGLLVPVSIPAQQLAFPGAVGHGAYATGGRSGTVYHVTNLSDSGSGSFRDAVSQPNRIVVFDVGGYINLASAVSAKNNLTIAGQTAPGDGIGIMGHELSFTSRSNEICRYIRIRPGSIASSTEDAINVGDGTNMIFDHVSLEFAPYNDIDAHGNHGPHLLSFQNSIIANPIGQQFGCHSEGLGGSITWYRNLWSDGHNRQPMAKMNTVFINNVEYNYQAGYTVSDTSGHFVHDIVNNYFIGGPSTSSPGNDFFQMNNNQIVYATGNLRDSDNNGTLSGSATTPSPVVTTNGPWSPWTTNVLTVSTTGAYFYALSVAGAFSANNNVFYNATNSWYRDQVDSQVFGEVITLGTAGHMWTSQTQSGLGNNGFGSLNTAFNPVDTDQDGIPDYWEVANGMDTNNASDALSPGPGGYTMVEVYLDWLVHPHAIARTNASVNVDLWQYTAGFTNASPTYVVSSPSNGTVTLLGDLHTAQFTPTTGFAGMAGFSYTVTAGTGDALTDVVSVVLSALPFPPLVPDAPSGLTATAAGTTQINLSWSDNATNETNYLIERSTDNSAFTQIASVNSNTTSYSDSGLTPAKTYYYRVRASNTGGLSSYSNTAQATTVAIPALTWVGDGVLNRWDLATSTNWFNGVTAAVFSNAAAVTFDDTGSASPPVTMVGGALQPLSVTVNASQTYTITASGGSLTGTMGLTKTGSGQLIMATNNAYSGGTTVNAGTLTIRATAAAGTGTITLNGGVLNNNASIANAITVTAPSTLIANGTEIDGAWRGNSTLNLLISGSQFTVGGSMSSFSGTFALGASSALFRFLPSAAGSSSAVFDLGTATGSIRTRNGNVSVNMGALIGGPNTQLLGASVGVSTTNATTYVVGNLNSNTTFRGTITENLNGTNIGYMTALTKVGTGILALTGTNGFGGGTKVNNGTLLVDGIHRMWSNSTTIVATNGLLGGSGIVSGKVVIVQASGALTPGDPVGTLTISGGLTLSNNSLVYLDLASVTNLASNDSIAMQLGTLTLVGTTTVIPNFLNGVLTNQTYTLISGGASTVGSAANLAWGGPTGTRQTFTFNTATAGTVLLNVTGNAATLSWTGINGILWDLNNTLNWTNAGVADKFFNADAVIFDDTAANGNVSVSGTVSPRSIVVSNSATAYTITSTNGVIAGTTSLVKLGDGLLTLNGSNTYSGGTTISAGTLAVNGPWAAGTGTITLNGGTLTLGASIANALSVAAFSALNPGSNTVSGPISGNAWLNVNISDANTFTVAGSMTGFSGIFELGPSTGFLQFNGSLGSASAVFDLGTGSATVNTLNGAVTISLGTLTGGTNTTLSGATAATDLTTYLVGGKNTTTNFDGRITDGMGPVAIIKAGSGTWTLTGTNNDYSGGTTVSNGTLLVNNIAGNSLGSGPVTVNSGATLGGTGIIEPLVTLANGAILAPGAGGVGTLTVDDDLVLGATSVLQYDLGTASDLTVVTGNLTLGGVLNISGAAGFGIGTYPLFTYGTLTTNGTPGVLTIGTVPNANLTYSVDISSNGYVNLIVSGPVAGFSASPTSGLAPLMVTFTDTSTGVITNRFWDFGDGNTTNFAAATNPSHAYAAGTYNVTLIVTGPAGVSTNTQLNLVAALTAFQNWQMHYFGCTACPQAVAGADPDGDGQSNLEEFLAGSNPTNGLSGLRIISTDAQTNDVLVTWITAGGRTNAVQATAGNGDGDYDTNFTDVSGPVVIVGTGDTTTNYLDVGAVTNAPTRYYRIRLVP